MENMVRLDGGTFLMGSTEFYEEEAPVREGSVSPFWIDAHPVTVADFLRFVRATGYRTVAEVAPDPSAYPDADPALLVPGSLVFQPTAGPVALRGARQLWVLRPGRRMAEPRGTGELDPRSPAASRDPGRVRRRRGVRSLGGKGVADRGRVGV